MLGVLVAQWMRASDREAVRTDRRLDREQRARVAAGAAEADDLTQPVWWEMPPPGPADGGTARGPQR